MFSLDHLFLYNSNFQTLATYDEDTLAILLYCLYTQETQYNELTENEHRIAGGTLEPQASLIGIELVDFN